MNAKQPDFFIAGAVKSGSTSLYHYLREHPEIYMSPVKEPHFFSYPDMVPEEFRPVIKKRIALFDLKKYLSGPMTQVVHRAYIKTREEYLLLFKNAGPESVIGEASTSYLWSPGAAARIKQMIPSARIIIVLRNPVERAFSHYLMDVKIGLEKRDFSTALREDLAVTSPSWGKNAMYVLSGMYSKQVERFYKQFDESQRMVILFDELKNDPGAAVRSIYSFLGVSPSFNPDFKKRYNVTEWPVNTLAGKIYNSDFFRRHILGAMNEGMKAPLKKFFFKTKGLPVLQAEDKSFLISVFEKDMVSLQKLIQKDLSHWLQ